MNVPIRSYLHRNSIQFKIGFIMILAVILLSATCYLLYRNLSSIVSSIRIDINPELRLLSIRDISMDLEKAGNSVRLYTITRDPGDIKPYYNIISNIDDKVSKLRSECKNDSALLTQTDTISKLITENIIIWNELLALYRDDRVVDYLRELSGQLDSASESNQRRERGILKRVFSRAPKSLLTEQELAEDLNEVVLQDATAKDELIVQESQLAANSSEIKEKSYDLITKMENEVYDHIEAKSQAAGLIAAKTYRLLVMLSISGGLLAILILYIIVRFVRKAYSYQIALENSKEEAEKLARTKELFMANMSHEIRTPVTAISGFTEQLLHDASDGNTIRLLNIIKSSSDHLIKIIDDILDFSKLQNKKLVLERVHFSLRQIMEDVFILFENQALRNNTKLTYSLSRDTPAVLIGDPYRLKQIMINLVSNSVKFTKNGTVHFAASSNIKQSDDFDLILEFNDTGIGIDESKLNVIFDDFTQAEMSTTRKYGGTGLGLSIVKKLVDLHNGTIDIDSRKNQGTNIICRIPLTRGDEKQLKKDPGHPLTVPSKLSGLKILIVDDEEYNRLLFKKILERWNLKCHEVVNGMEALEILKEKKFDLLFMDMRMPGIDGLKTTQFLRNEMKIKESDMPVVFISAAPLDDDWQKYRKAGMNAFLQKPFTEETLLSTILTVTGNTIPTNVKLHETGDLKTDKGDLKTDLRNKIDLRNLYHISGGDLQFVKQMLESFISTTGKLLNDIRDLVNSGKWEPAADLAHKASPPCRHLGAIDLYNILAQIEKAARNNDHNTQLNTLTGKASAEFNSVKVLIEDHIAKMN